MSDTLKGFSEADMRLRKLVNQTNSGGIEYPKGTNERGYPGHSHHEHHAHGERVGEHHEHHHRHHEHKEHHARGERVGGEGCAPGRGGSHMHSHFGEPEHGRKMGAPRHMAVKQARAENHRRGEMVGESGHEHAEMKKIHELEHMHRKHHKHGEHVEHHRHHEEKRHHRAMGGMPQSNAMMQGRSGMPHDNVMQPGQPQPLRRGGKSHPHHHRYER
jgi:hypothetical protein